MSQWPPSPNYTCTDYREEMRLMALKRSLNSPDLPEDKRLAILAEIEALEKKMGM